MNNKNNWEIAAKAINEPELKITCWDNDYIFVYFRGSNWFNQNESGCTVDFNSGTWKIFEEKPKLKEVKYTAFENIDGGGLMYTSKPKTASLKYWKPLYFSNGNPVEEVFYTRED